MYLANEKRYETMQYRHCGKSGLKLPVLSLGLWHNFGHVTLYDNAREMIRKAFDLGITHFDLANNYGPPAGSAEENLGKILKNDFSSYRDELIISSKAGFDMWEGPYGRGGSRKYLISSLDQSLKRLGLDYVDIFYHHVPDEDTPVEESMLALDAIVRQGKALYVGISNYNAVQAKEAIGILNELKTPCIIHQPSYSMFNRWIEDGLLKVLEEEGKGCIVYSPLSQGLLTNRYLNGIPKDSRAGGQSVFLNQEQINEEVVSKIRQLNQIAVDRGQSLAQMALSWVLRHSQVTSAIVGASRVSQIEDSVKAVHHLNFSEDELIRIEEILK